MRMCEECGKKCRKKFRLKKGYRGKDRYHKLIKLNEEYMAVGCIIICQECMNWSKDITFCGKCLDINPICGFYDRNRYLGICNNCSQEICDVNNPSSNLDIAFVYSHYNKCDKCKRICNKYILEKGDIKKNNLHCISGFDSNGKYHYLAICERCFKWKEETNIYCSSCGFTDSEFVDAKQYPSLCLKCKEDQDRTTRLLRMYSL